jgi:hypothetical protein
MKRLWLHVFSLALLFVSLPALASSETITNFKSISSLGADDVLRVDETITVDFGGISHHGIYRDIPVIRRSNSDMYYYNFKFLGSSDTSSQSKTGDFVRLRLGDANTTISGRHEYTISYTLAPVALAAGDHDRVFLNATGDGWEYPILHAQYELSLPVAPTGTPVCYAGQAQTQQQYCTLSVSGNKISAISTQTLMPGSGLSVDASVPSGTFTNYLIAGKAPAKDSQGFLGLAFMSVFGIAFLGIFASSLIIPAIFVVILWKIFIPIIKENKRKHQQTVVPQYEAPDGLMPAEIGMITDSVSSTPELTATIIDLAIRGYIKIELVRKKSFFFSADYRFTSVNGDRAGLQDYECTTLDMIFPDGVSPMKLSEITSSGGISSGFSTKNTAVRNAALMDQIQHQLEDSLTSKNYYNRRQQKFFQGPVRLSDAGLLEWAKVEGFKLYLKVAEKDRLDFSDAPSKTPERFNKLLPYAVALGVEKQWAKQFEGMDLSQTTNWYSGDSGTIGNAAFASSFAGSFASNFSSSMSSGFSGSSGSGSSGGGGGGGGGGGW